MTETKTHDARWAALVVASVGYFFVLLDVTIVNVALASVGVDLSASRPELQWVVDAYALVLACTMLGAGDLGDRFGTRRLLLGGLVVFGLASTLCALAPSSTFLIGARAVQGLGAAAILPGSLAIVNQLFPDPRERPRAIGIWAGLGGSALVLGPILGGLLVDPIGWRSIFWLNVPLVLASLAGVIALVPEGPTAPRGARADVPGQLLGTTALAGFLFALIEGGHSRLVSPAVLIGGTTALAALVGFLLAERRSPRPLIDLRWFAQAQFSGANAGSALMNFGTLGALFALGLYLQQSRHLSPLSAGLNLVPLALPLAALTPFTGRIVSAVGPRLPAGLGLLASGVGYLGVALLGARAIGTPGDWALLALAGAGMGLAVPGLVAGATEALGSDRSGIAAAVNNTSRQVGGAIGVALIGGFSTVALSLEASGAALLLGGALALLLIGRQRPDSSRRSRTAQQVLLANAKPSSKRVLGHADTTDPPLGAQAVTADPGLELAHRTCTLHRSIGPRPMPQTPHES
jgi:DHA2 family methylenomycin A resistance protein-like MFS transporter